MSQRSFVMSFRARLKSGGYTDIHIRRAKEFKTQELYFVSCRDPFGYMLCERYLDMFDMMYWR